jgi:hypothetical protein
MEIHLRQHEDGSYVLEVKHRNFSKEIEVTGIIRDIVVDKIRTLQDKLDLEEKYRNWNQPKKLLAVCPRSPYATKQYSVVSRRLIAQSQNSLANGKKVEH